MSQNHPMTSPSLHQVTVLTIPQVAERLGCSNPHVYRLINTGALPAVDIASPGSPRTKTRVRVDDLEGFLQSSRVSSASQNPTK